MNLLEKIAKGFGQAALVVGVTNPLVNAALPFLNIFAPKIVPKITQIQSQTEDTLVAFAQLAGMIEMIGQNAKFDKADTIAPLIGQVVLQSSIMTGHRIADQGKFLAACKGIGGNVADLLKSLEEIPAQPGGSSV
jgi:hypothetical protein